MAERILERGGESRNIGGGSSRKEVTKEHQRHRSKKRGLRRKILCDPLFYTTQSRHTLLWLQLCRLLGFFGIPSRLLGKKHFRWLQDLVKLTEVMARMCADVIKGKDACFEQSKIQNIFWFVQHMHVLYMAPHLFLPVLTHNIQKTWKQWMRRCVQTYEW